MTISIAPSLFLFLKDHALCGPMRPPSYPLPLTSQGVAYWQVNLALCSTVPGWREWQTGREMAQIIPTIEARISDLTAPCAQGRDA